MEIAVLDLCSTTFHLQHVRVDAGDAFVTTLDTKRNRLLIAASQSLYAVYVETQGASPS